MAFRVFYHFLLQVMNDMSHDDVEDITGKDSDVTEDGELIKLEDTSVSELKFSTCY